METSNEGSTPGTVILSGGWNAPRPRLTFCRPIDILIAHSIRDVAPVLREAVAQASSGRYAAGFLTYEAAPAFDPALQTHDPTAPIAWFATYEHPRPSTLDPRPSPSPRPPSTAPPVDPRPPTFESFAISNPAFSVTESGYNAALAEIHARIHEGDVYQINFTAPLTFDLDGSPLALWQALIERQPVPYGAYVDTGDVQILSVSPELFFRRDADTVVTRPMKGTVRRGASPEEDDDLETWLAADEKSRAENLMIVDLLRNDLSRCCTLGSVRVPKLFTTERYETVIQMTSEIEGRLRTGIGTADIFAALFPCGSVTGAPKIEAMRVIRELEGGPRGVYCGAIGVMHRDQAVFNVAIRTASVSQGRGVLGIGSGVVWDSVAQDEYQECLLKGRFLTELAEKSTGAGTSNREIQLIETMRADDGSIPLLELHADRLRQSARALGFRLDEEAWRRRVTEAIEPQGRHKVRSLLRFDGSFEVSVQPLNATKSEWTAVLSDRRIDATDVYRRHKTTNRRMYDREWKSATSAGFDEVVFLNENDEVAEGSRTNVVVVVGSAWLTPPVASGALPGVYRRRLMETRGLRERTLHPDDFEKADEVYLCNAVAGLVRAKIALAPKKIREDVK